MVEPAAKRLRGTSSSGVHVSTREVNAGIVYYAGQHPGFHGIVKQRFCDFQVSEIDPLGRMATLTSTDIPVVEKAAPAPAPAVSVSQSLETLTLLVGAAAVAELQALSRGEQQGGVTLPALVDKTQRTQVHQALKRLENLASTTVDGCIVVQRGKNEQRSVKTRDAGYCRFVLWKENMDTMAAVKMLAQRLQLRDAVFAVAGTKDRRGITTQYVTAKIAPQRLAKVNIPGLRCGNFESVQQPLRLGELQGNNFRIALRHVTAPEEVLHASAEQFASNGFINYFGLQRFGNCMEVPTWQIGQALLRSDWAAAVDLVLQERAGDTGEAAPARQHWSSTKAATSTLAKMPSHMRIERTILQHLAAHPSDYLGAFTALPRNMRLLYLHSYQSFVWNSMVSRRIEIYGQEPVVGDLVMATDNDTNVQIAAGDENGLRVKILSAADLASHTKFDLILPLPGYAMILPTNQVGAAYRACMAAHGIPESLRSNIKELSLSGSYRKIFEQPRNFKWYTAHYHDFKMPVIPPVGDMTASLDYRLIATTEEVLPAADAGKQNMAVVVEMTLSSSTYATMALRELMKIPTDVDFHRSLQEGKHA